MQDSGTLYYLYQILTPTEKREVTYQLTHREKLSGKSSLVKELHLALGKSKAPDEEALFKVLPAAKKWKDLAQTKRKLLRAIMDTLLSLAEHPAAVVRRMVTELEILAKHGQHASVLSVAEAIISFARKHELYREAIDSFYLWDAAHSITQTQDEALPVSDRASMLMAMLADAECLRKLDRAEQYYQQTLLAHLQGNTELLERLHREDDFVVNVERDSVRFCGYVLRARLNIAIGLALTKAILQSIELLIMLVDRDKNGSMRELFLQLPTLVYYEGLLSIGFNDEIKYQESSQRLKVLTRTAVHHELAKTLYFSLAVEYYQKKGQLEKQSQLIRKIALQLGEDGDNFSKPTPVLFQLAILSYSNEDYDTSAKQCLEFLSMPRRLVLSRFIMWVCLVISDIERGLLELLPYHCKMAISDLGGKADPAFEAEFFGKLAKQNGLGKQDLKAKLESMGSTWTALVAQGNCKLMDQKLQFLKWVTSGK